MLHLATGDEHIDAILLPRKLFCLVHHALVEVGSEKPRRDPVLARPPIPGQGRDTNFNRGGDVNFNCKDKRIKNMIATIATAKLQQ